MRGGKRCRWRLDDPVSTRTLLFLALLGLLVLAVSCGSEGPSEPSRKPSPSSPVVEKADSEVGTPASSGTSPSTAVPATVSTGTGAGQATPYPDAVTPLQIESIDFDPARPIAGEPIKVQVVFEKPEMASVPLHYRWKLNDETIEGLDTNVLDHATKRGDRIEVAVFVGDRRQESRARGAMVTVANASPIVKKVEEHFGGDREYVARLVATDPDGDTVALKLQRGPAGMVLDSGSSELRWSVPEGTNGNFPVEVLASDPVGAGMIFAYTITIRQERSSEGSAANATSTSTPSQ